MLRASWQGSSVATSSTQLPVLLDRNARDSLAQQLGAQLREAIRRARIPPGTRLPSSRALARQLVVSRNTVNRAFDALVAEGYLESRPASGYFACAVQPASPVQRLIRRDKPEDVGQIALMPMPRLPHGSDAMPPAPHGRLTFDFLLGHTDPAQFPVKTWRRLTQTTLAYGGGSGLSKPLDPGGLPALRQAIADYLSVTRGIVADPVCVVIVSGAQEGISLLASLFLAPGDLALLEDPGPSDVAQAFAMVGAEAFGVGVDENGLDPGKLPTRPAKLLHVSPGHQFPTGHVLSPERRAALAAWARQTGCYLIEDDRNAELRFEGGQPPAIAADAEECTIYLGSFWQSLGPGFGIGYMVVPAHLVSAVIAAKRLRHGSDSWLEQATLAEMLKSGAYGVHVTRQKEHYRGNRDAVLAALRANFGEAATSGQSGGLHLAWHLPPGVPDAAIVESIGRRARVGVYTFATAGARATRSQNLATRTVLLGFGALRPKLIAQGLARLSDAIDDAVDDPFADVSRLFTPLLAPIVRSKPARPGRPRRLDRHEGQQLALSGVIPSHAHLAATVPISTGVPVASLTEMYRYPVKGLSGQKLDRVGLEANRPFPLDRIFALAKPGAPIDRRDPKWAKKGLFCMLMLDEGLARVETSVDLEKMHFRALQAGRTVFTANLLDAGERAELENFVWKLLPALSGPPTLLHNRDGHFMDKPDSVISLINLATLKNLEERWGGELDPLRFRANLYIDGARPWEEFEWVGTEVRIGGVRFRVDRRNGRCGATNVNPATGRRDLDIPGSLRATFGHKDLGVYLVALEAGTLTVGDAVVASAGEARNRSVAATRPAAPDGALPRHICGGCYFVYEQARGLPQQFIAPDTPFADLPTDWRCPDCGIEKAQFRMV